MPTFRVTVNTRSGEQTVLTTAPTLEDAEKRARFILRNELSTVPQPLWASTELDHRFKEFHEQNPQVYLKLVDLAHALRQRGHKRLGIKMLFEVLRWQHYMLTTDPDYKLNNNYHSRYARLIMENEPQLAGFFCLRELKGDSLSYDPDLEAV